jgi:uncharacterized protein YdhG (YjbR/CyaY superfamily)
MQDFSDYIQYICDDESEHKAMIAKLRQVVQEYETLEDLKRDIEIIYMQSL